MRLVIQLRLLALGLGVVLMAALIALLTYNSQRQATEVRARLSQLESESFLIAERFKDAQREVNDQMRRYASFREAPVWQAFLHDSQNLQDWIREQGPRLRTQREKEVLAKMETAYQGYVQRAQELHTLIEGSGQSGASLAQYNSFFEEARHLRDLSEQLSHAHFESRNELLAQATRTLTRLRQAVLCLVALLFICGLALAAGVYRDLIAPLRLKLVQSQHLAERREKMASLGLLAAGVAHEIRNPLAALKTALFIQQKKLAPGSPEHRDSQLIEREILRLERIVTGFLQFARPAEPSLAAIPADQPLREVQALLDSSLAAKDIRLIREESPPMRIQADAAQIQQVLLNLVQNAADSIGAHGTITLRARRERRELPGGQTDAVILEVADTGRGIPPEVQKRLLDPFFTTKDQGTGLGLSIAARLLEGHGGALQYQTELDRGSTFGVVLPELTS